MLTHKTFDSLIANSNLPLDKFCEGLEAADHLHAALMHLNAGSPRMADGFSPTAVRAGIDYKIEQAKRKGTPLTPAQTRIPKPGLFWLTQDALLNLLEHLYPLHGQAVLERMFECGERPSSAAIYVFEDLQRAERERAQQDMLDAHDDGRHASGDPFFVTNCPACRQGISSPLVQLYP